MQLISKDHFGRSKVLQGYDFRYAIHTVHFGFFDGFNRSVALGSVIVVAAMIFWIIVFPEHSTATLAAAKATLLVGARGWFLYCMVAIMVVATLIAAIPLSGRMRLACDKNTRPSFSTGSWLSMMFCGGIGTGMVTYAVAEPLSHFTSNPELIQGTLEANGVEAARAAVKYAFLHWGLSAWFCYSMMGLALALFSFRYGLPLTIRTVVAPLLGRRLEGPIGHLIDGFSIVAIVAGIATTMGYGAQSLSAGLNFLNGGSLYEDGATYMPAVLAALALIAALAMLTVTSGVGRGMKWLSNIGTALVFALAVFFALHSGADGLAKIGLGATWDYFAQLPTLTLSVFNDTTTVQGKTLSTWQTDWTIFYWAWWLAFAPFVSLFIARISEGRTIREFILGSVMAPCGACFVWFACSGTAALSLEMASDGGILIGRSASEQLFAALWMMSEGLLGQVFAWAALVLVFVMGSVTFASGVLAITTIAAAGDNTQKPAKHLIMWAILSALVIGALLAVGGTDTIRDVMVLSALPISIIIVFGMVSLGLVLFLESQGTRTTVVEFRPRDLLSPAMAQEKIND